MYKKVFQEDSGIRNRIIFIHKNNCDENSVHCKLKYCITYTGIEKKKNGSEKLQCVASVTIVV